MWMRNKTIAANGRFWLAAVVCILFAGLTAWAQRQGLPPGPMQEKARTACLACHDARIIVQQRLDKRGWTKDIDKMIRWGAPVEPADREPLIEYFAQSFPATAPESGKAAETVLVDAKLVEAPGVEKVRATCLSCHGGEVITAERFDRRTWTQVLERQIRWGAPVRAQDREAVLSYLVANYGPGGPGFASGNIQILTPTGGVDFTNYVARMLGSVRRNWYAIIPESARMGQKGRTILDFSILRDGKVPADDPVIVSSSGSTDLDRAAVSAIRVAAPFESLPTEFKGPLVRFRFIFLYNIKSDER